MPKNIFTRYQTRSHRYLGKINVNTKNLHQIPTKIINNRRNVSRRRIIGIIFATIAAVCVLLAMTLPFIINLNKNISNTTITASNSIATTSSNTTTVTNIITTVATTASITSVTNTTTYTTTTTASTTITTASTTITTDTTTSTTTTDTTTSTTTTTTSTTTTTASTTTTTDTSTSTTTTDTSTSTTTTDTTTSTATTTTDTSTSTTTTDTTTSTTSVTTTTTTQNPYACSNMTILVGYDLGGYDLTFQYTANYTMCCAFCLSNSSCMAFTWVVGSSSNPCYLKYAVPTPSANPTLISAHY